MTGNRVSLTWDPAPGAAPAGYIVEGGVTPGQVLAALRADGSATSLVFDAPTGAFYLRLYAWTGAGRSPASNEIRIFVNVPQLPAAPTGLLGLADGANLALSWKAGTGGGLASSYILDVSGALTLSVPIAPSETFAFTGVPTGTYTFAVRAVNGAGSSPPSPPVTLAFPSACPGPPQAPTSFAVSRRGLAAERQLGSAERGTGGVQLRAEGHRALNLVLPLGVRSISGVVPSGIYNLSVLAVNPCGTGPETLPQAVTVP